MNPIFIFQAISYVKSVEDSVEEIISRATSNEELADQTHHQSPEMRIILFKPSPTLATFAHNLLIHNFNVLRTDFDSIPMQTTTILMLIPPYN